MLRKDKHVRHCQVLPLTRPGVVAGSVLRHILQWRHSAATSATTSAATGFEASMLRRQRKRTGVRARAAVYHSTDCGNKDFESMRPTNGRRMADFTNYSPCMCAMNTCVGADMGPTRRRCRSSGRGADKRPTTKNVVIYIYTYTRVEQILYIYIYQRNYTPRPVPCAQSFLFSQAPFPSQGLIQPGHRSSGLHDAAGVVRHCWTWTWASCAWGV